MAIQKDIPFCPLMSVAANVDMVCTQERCLVYSECQKMFNVSIRL